MTAPAPSAEARRLIDYLVRRALWNKDHIEADRALSAYVAGLEAEVTRLRVLARDVRPYIAHHDDGCPIGSVKPLLARLDAAHRARATDGGDRG